MLWTLTLLPGVSCSTVFVPDNIELFIHCNRLVKFIFSEYLDQLSILFVAFLVGLRVGLEQLPQFVILFGCPCRLALLASQRFGPYFDGFYLELLVLVHFGFHRFALKRFVH